MCWPAVVWPPVTHGDPRWAMVHGDPWCAQSRLFRYLRLEKAVSDARRCLLDGLQERQTRDVTRLCKVLLDALKSTKKKQELTKAKTSADALKSAKPSAEGIGLTKIADGSMVIELYGKARDSSVRTLDTIIKVTLEVTQDDIKVQHWSMPTVDAFKALNDDTAVQSVENFPQLYSAVRVNITNRVTATWGFKGLCLTRRPHPTHPWALGSLDPCPFLSLGPVALWAIGFLAH